MTVFSPRRSPGGRMPHCQSREDCLLCSLCKVRDWLCTPLSGELSTPRPRLWSLRPPRTLPLNYFPLLSSGLWPPDIVLESWKGHFSSLSMPHDSVYPTVKSLVVCRLGSVGLLPFPATDVAKPEPHCHWSLCGEQPQSV